MNQYKKYGAYLMILVPIIIFYGAFFKYTVNIPINDDYVAILDFINKCIATDSFSEKVRLIFSQHNEHRIVYDRIWTIISYKTNGQVNFNFLALIGNLSLIGIFFIFCKKALIIDKNIAYLIPISVLIFNLSFYENMTFAMATLSNFTVFVFSLLCVYFLSKDLLTNKKFLFAMVFLILATLTQASGLFLIPLGFFILVYKKDKKKLLIFALISILIIGLYFFDYQKPQASPSIGDTFLYFKVRAALFSFALLGNAFNYNLIFTNDLNDSIGLTTVIGFLFFVIYLYAIKTKYYKKNLFVFAIMSLIVFTAFMTGITRCQLGLETAGASRYRINGVVFLIALYLWFLETNHFKKKKIFTVILCITTLIYLLVFNLSQYEYLSFRKKQTLTGVLNYQSGDATKLNGFEQERYKKILVEAEERQTYILPTFNSLQSYFPYATAVSFKKDDQNSEKMYSNIDNTSKIKDSQMIEGWAFVEDQATNQQQIFVGLKSKNKLEPVYYTADQVTRFDLNPYFKKSYLKNGGFSCRIKDSDIEAGENEIWIMVKVNNQTKLMQTDKKVIR